jgi:3-deoxy-D-manno-octulosonic-acid transferase
MGFLYDIIFFAYALVYLPYLVLTRRWYPGFGMRFGFFPSAFKAEMAGSGNIWVHAVSVGEVAAVAGLVRRLKVRYPRHRIVCSVTTKTGYHLARTQLADVALVIPSPLDLSGTVAAFTRVIRPVVYIAAETELWPNLFCRLAKENVPIVIVNGRISDRSFGRYQAVQFFLKGALRDVRAFCMQSDTDAERIRTLGADPARVRVVGNIKFEDDGGGAAPETLRVFPTGQQVWIAGSTHPGEEAIVLAVYRKMRDAGLPWCLVLAPRHVERAGEVMGCVRQAGFEGRVFSTLTPGSRLTAGEVLVVDTIGHLRGLYAQASLVFIGKSLRVGGGQNVIEPAFFARAVIVGPMMENFRDILARFKEDGAIVQVKDDEEFSDAVLALARDEGRRAVMGQKAAAVIAGNKGALERTLACVREITGPL